MHTKMGMDTIYEISYDLSDDNIKNISIYVSEDILSKYKFQGALAYCNLHSRDANICVDTPQKMRHSCYATWIWRSVNSLPYMLI